MTSLPCERGVDEVQATLPALPKDSLWSIPCFSEAEALLSGAPNHSSDKTPPSDIINNNDATGRVAKWGIELAAFEITYKRRDAIKSQALADFIADWTEMPDALHCRSQRTGGCTLTDQSCSTARGLVYCYSHQKETSYTTFCRSTSRLQTTWRSMKHSFTD